MANEKRIKAQANQEKIYIPKDLREFFEHKNEELGLGISNISAITKDKEMAIVRKQSILYGQRTDPEFMGKSKDVSAHEEVRHLKSKGEDKKAEKMGMQKIAQYEKELEVLAYEIIVICDRLSKTEGSSLATQRVDEVLDRGDLMNYLIDYQDTKYHKDRMFNLISGC